MDSEDDFDVEDAMGGYIRPPTREPCPRPGRNREFDRHFVNIFGDLDPDEADIEEMRLAAWATWRTEAPTPLQASGSNQNEDEELARVLALSAQEHQNQSSGQGSTSRDPIAIDDDDEIDLRRAIAISEQEARASKRQKREETPEEERRMLAEALAASLIEKQKPEIEEEVSDDEELKAVNEAAKASREAFREEERKRRQLIDTRNDLSTVTPTLSGAAIPSATLDVPVSSQTLKVGGQVIDRAQLERERRARQAAREAQAQKSGNSSANSGRIAGPSSVAESKIKSFSDITNGGGSSSATGSNGDSGSSNPRASASTTSGPSHPFQIQGRPPTDAAGEYFLDGELRHTALTIGNPTSEPTFSPQQVIGDKSQIALIIMSSFVIDEEWMATIMPRPEIAPTIMIRPHPKDMHPQWNGKVQAQVNEEVRCYPQMVGDWGSAHMKFAWIFYKTGRLRVMIGTANMVPYDWEWIENTIFVQDFLQPSTPVPIRENHPPHDLPIQFRSLFIHLKVHKALRHLSETHPYKHLIPFKHTNEFEDMAKWDFSRIKVRIVMSVPGSYTGYQEMDKFGICRLGKVLRDEGWVAGKGERIVTEFQGSSLGQYEMSWFDTFYQYCSGKDTRSLMNRPKPSSWPPMKVIFPSLATVDKSVLGRDGGGTMFCGKAWNKISSPLFHDANSKRGGVLMHAKVLIGIFEPLPKSLGFQQAVPPTPPKASGKRKMDEMDSEEPGVGGWIYIGSHNFSSAAWGNVNLKKNPPILSVRNYEIGIVFPLPRLSTNAIADRIAPYRRPARKYGTEDQPWSQALHGKPSE